MSIPRSIDSQPRLSEGPQDISTLRLGPRESEFIELRYGQVLPIKTVAERMNITERTVKYYSFSLFLRFNLTPPSGNDPTHTIRITKLLIKYGFIKV